MKRCKNCNKFVNSSHAVDFPTHELKTVERKTKTVTPSHQASYNQLRQQAYYEIQATMKRPTPMVMVTTPLKEKHQVKPGNQKRFTLNIDPVFSAITSVKWNSKSIGTCVAVAMGTSSIYGMYLLSRYAC